MFSNAHNTLARFGGLIREMDELLEAQSFAPFASSRQAGWPGVNLWRDGDQLIAEAEIPGFREDDVEVMAVENSLTIRGRRTDAGPQGATPMRVERSLSEFERWLRLPVEVDADAVEATLEHGVLRVTLPIAESARPRRVRVKALEGRPTREALPAGNADSTAAKASTAEATAST